MTEDLALKQAARADRDIAAGNYRGPLHGIPWGAKDLLSTRGIPTTWGATPFKDQMIDEDATVVQRLEEAGAVMVAKLTLGALAWGDVWFGWAHQQSVEPGTGVERLVGRAGVRHGGGSGRFRHRLGDLGLDRFTIDPLRHDRAAAHLRSRQPPRGDGPLMDDG